jgi:hypothetical protein
MRIRHTAPLIGLLCLVLAGCTTTSEGEPTPETTTSTDSPSTGHNDDLPTNGAPKVDNPIDATRFAQDPCATLTTTQATDLNVPTTGEPADIIGGVGCEWANRETRGWILVGFFTEGHSGLSAIYAANERGDFAFFEPLPDINGHPAVASDVDDGRARGLCTVLVGVTDELVTQISVRLSAANVGEKDPCEVTVDVADMALQTMKKGA